MLSRFGWFACAGFCFLWGNAASLAAQEAARAEVLTLDKAIHLALSNGYEGQLLSAGLAQARAQYAQVLAGNGISLSANMENGVSLGAGDRRVLGNSGVGIGVPLAIEGSVDLSAPATRLSLSAAHNMLIPEDGDIVNRSNVGLSITQSLWDGYPGGTASAAIEKAVINLELAGIKYETDRTALKTRIRQAFFAVLTAQQTLELQRSIRTQRSELARQIGIRFEGQRASEIDFKEAALSVRSAEVDVIEAQNGLSTTRAALARFLNLPEDRLPALSTEALSVPEVNLTEAVRSALERRKEFRQLSYNERIAGIDKELIVGGTGPSLSLTGSANLQVDWAEPAASAGTVSATLRFGLPIADSGLSASRLSLADIQLRNHALQGQHLEGSIAEEVRTAFNDLEVKKQRLSIEEESAGLAQNRYEIAQTRFDIGTATSKDLADALTSLSQARLSVLRSDIAVQLAALNLQTVMGIEEAL